MLIGAAVWYRQRPEVHKRLMLLALIGGMTGAPVAHLIGHWPALLPFGLPIAVGSLFVLLCLGAIHDKLSEGRVHPVSLWAQSVCSYGSTCSSRLSRRVQHGETSRGGWCDREMGRTVAPSHHRACTVALSHHRTVAPCLVYLRKIFR
jgi:hypothetical protein